MTASDNVDSTNRYPGTFSRTAGRAVRPLIASSAAATNAVAPNSATGMPRMVLKRLRYTCVQLMVSLTSQKLR